MQNVYQVFQSDPVLHGAIGYNILTGRIDICKPLWWERTTSAMSDTDFNYLMLYLEKRYGLNNENRIRRALTVVAHQNQYHPIREYLNRLEWDGTERLTDEEIVRCEDCKWCMAYGKATYCDRFAHELPAVEPDGFCAWACRKEQ